MLKSTYPFAAGMPMQVPSMPVFGRIRHVFGYLQLFCHVAHTLKFWIRMFQASLITFVVPCHIFLSYNSSLMPVIYILTNPMTPRLKHGHSALPISLPAPARHLPQLATVP